MSIVEFYMISPAIVGALSGVLFGVKLFDLNEILAGLLGLVIGAIVGVLLVLVSFQFLRVVNANPRDEREGLSNPGNRMMIPFLPYLIASPFLAFFGIPILIEYLNTLFS